MLRTLLSLFILIAILFSCSSNDGDDALPDDDPIDTNDDTFIDTFDGSGDLIDYTTNNASALPNVQRFEGRYKAELTENSQNQTLHFNEEQGRLDAKRVSFPFEFIARNIGIGTLTDSQIAPAHEGEQYNFAGVQVHVLELSDPNSAHVVVGHRGNTGFTIEGKNTLNGSSSVNDIGANTVSEGRADIRIVGNEDRTITVSWQTPNLNLANQQDEWILYNGTGNMPGEAPTFGSEVYVGLITYAFYTEGVPFVGTCDQIEITEN
ncbi:hypothetical protein SAMN05421640_1011 [Ekhidna lutea]|uniref:Lipoprotein n=1 Tax=Ekhidna lutea TaxID=447679 RepID=A0A239GU71_EKHLU|nr:hypothetical protein [Ekhidna lutea]SNS72759.1 hypothetical protein SAMN05421640_1011 [Ekhidna lutea]